MEMNNELTMKILQNVVKEEGSIGLNRESYTATYIKEYGKEIHDATVLEMYEKNLITGIVAERGGLNRDYIYVDTKHASITSLGELYLQRNSEENSGEDYYC